MNVQKFVAINSREALRQVRDALGADAIILSNRMVAEGVEIMALAARELAAMSAPAVEREAEPRLDWGRTSNEPRATSGYAQTVRPVVDSCTVGQVQPMTAATDLAANVGWDSDTITANQGVTREMLDMMQEIRAMRSMLETQLSEMAWESRREREPHRTQIMRELLSAGFSPGLARHLLEHMPEVKNLHDGMQWIKAALARNLQVMHNEQDLLERGGVFALVGPTGVGKTTTTAKLAARCVMRHGANSLALITTDAYRIGAHEQLRIYGKILGVMVHTVRDESDLRIALAELSNKHTVLIDTVGMNQRDHMVAEQVAMLSGTGVEVQRLLCLNATSTGETLNEVVKAYQGAGLAGCIVTKLDEAATMGNVLDVMIRNRLKLYYAANGQRVPEDLHLMNRELLVDRAFRVRREMSVFQYQDEDLAAVVAGTKKAARELGGLNLV